MQFSADRKARVMIVDDHSLVREGMAMLINCEPDMQVCCAADQVEQAINASRSCAHDIAIVDMTLGAGSGLELVRRLQFEFPDLPVLMLSMHDESIYAEPALKAGARGYLMKQAATSVLLQAMRQVLNGDLYVSDQLRSRMLKKMRLGAVNDTSINSLTPSELEVLHLIGMGMGTSEISEKLARSVKTVESHKANIKKKLDLENGNQLTLFAINFVSAGKM
ncbi:MAG TPA: response regulator transcription factor [Gallionella sp.]|nr:response regulator transcription factor [Gallionella sp.]